MSRVRLTIREGGKVRRSGHGSLEEALDALELEMRALAATTRRRPVDVKVRRFEPVQQVAARAEIAAPRVRAGVDVRGDGSAEAFVGRWRRRLLEQHGRDSPYDALRRELL